MTQNKNKFQAALIGAMLFFLPAYAGTDATTGSIRGTVFTADPDGKQSVIPEAQVKVTGARTLEIQTDPTGSYKLGDLPPGAYSIEVTAPGLRGASTVTVAIGEVADAPVELKMEEVKIAVTVNDTSETVATSKAIGKDVISAQTLDNAPNKDERFDSALPLIPGVLRGPDGTINLKGARSSQSGSLLNGSNVADPVTGSSVVRLPMEVVSSLQVISNPYDPEYGKLAGAVATVDTKTSSYTGFHASVQNLLPRPRKRDGSVLGVENYQPRTTVTGPIIKDKLAFTQSFEYRYTRAPVPSLPQLQRDTKLESFDSYSQLDWMINGKQSATVSFAVYPQKLDYIGLNTFTPQASTPDLHQRGHMVGIQHRFITGSDSLLVSQFNYRSLDADLRAQSDQPYRLLVETTQGGFFNRQNRDTYRNEWQETYHFGRMNLLGSHQVKAGLNYAYSNYDGRMQLNPIDIIGTNGNTIQRTEFGPASNFNVNQHEVATFVADKWAPLERLTVDYGVRMDHDSVTHTTNAAPRVGLAYSLTNDGKTLLKSGAGIFYDRVILNIPAFTQFPSRTIIGLDSFGQAVSSMPYGNAINGGIQTPRSATWNIEVDRELASRLLLRVGYQQRNTSRDFVLSPVTTGGVNQLSLSNSGLSQYREFQVTTRYQFLRNSVNASYVRSKAFGDYNDFNQYFGNNPQAVVQQNQRGRLAFDAPNRFVFWGDFNAPLKLQIAPAIDVHTGFPHGVQNQERVYVGPRDSQRYARFSSVDLQVTRQIRTPILGKARVGVSVFNILNHYNPRDVQNITDSDRFGGYYNSLGRTFRGKYVLEF